MAGAVGEAKRARRESGAVERQQQANVSRARGSNGNRNAVVREANVTRVRM